MKPENILITAGGDVKIIDFGAAADLCTGQLFSMSVGSYKSHIQTQGSNVCPDPFMNFKVFHLVLHL